jgi:hypothetical protein
MPIRKADGHLPLHQFDGIGTDFVVFIVFTYENGAS